MDLSEMRARCSAPALNTSLRALSQSSQTRLIVAAAARQDEVLHGGEVTLLGIDRNRKTGAARALLATTEAGDLVYAGAAFIALRPEVREELRAKLEKLAAERPPIPWLRKGNSPWDAFAPCIRQKSYLNPACKRPHGIAHAIASGVPSHP
jgi:hypothetical protein